MKKKPNIKVFRTPIENEPRHSNYNFREYWSFTLPIGESYHGLYTKEQAESLALSMIE